ncbi:hypothetical protein [Desulfovibrio sp. X2]|uniref:hypothetical protein n=1 Tax=Desulfovibrio sp. X2 TaxID=941449 RepID=UPI0012682069|nr:hypothetical protein [Desulfovibrio sp. X2]
MRHYFFTAFLTAGSFILSLITMMLFNLQSRLFDSKLYIERHEKHVAMTKSKQKRYDPLINLGTLLLICVGFCLASSIIQISFGFIHSNLVATLCMSIAFVTLLLIIYTWLKVYATIQVWFEILNKDKDE